MIYSDTRVSMSHGIGYSPIISACMAVPALQVFQVINKARNIFKRVIVILQLYKYTTNPSKRNP